MSAVLEAEIILMPPKAREAVQSFGIGLSIYLLTSGGTPPGEKATVAKFVGDLQRVGGDRSDLEWLVSAGFMFASALDEWERS